MQLFSLMLALAAAAPAQEAGVNYLGRWHMYRTPEAILKRDFERFRRDGLTVIVVALYWYRLEGPQRGDFTGEAGGEFYGDRFLAEVKRVIETARASGLKVLVAFHTLWGDDSEWCTPAYVRDPVSGKRQGAAIYRSEEMEQAFLDATTHAVQFLRGTPGIWAWAVLNEPWYWPHTLPAPHEGIDQKASTIDLIGKLSRMVHDLDGRPVTAKFVNMHTWRNADGSAGWKNIFVEDWGWDQRLLDALDFVGLNAYRPDEPELVDVWQKTLTENVRGLRERRKAVWITEFGTETNDDARQAEGVRLTTAFFRGLPVEGWIVWFWQSDQTERPDEFGYPGKGFNVCGDGEGDGRPGYEALVQSVR
jgi:hypothetical protein